MHSAKLPPCYTQLFKKQLATSMPAGAAINAISLTFPAPPPDSPANVVRTGTGTFTVRVNGQPVVGYVSVGFIAGPLIEAEVDAENIGTPVPATLVDMLVTTGSTRVGQV